MTNTIGILLVEDDPDIASALARGLKAQNYHVRQTASVDDALPMLDADDVTAAIVDVMIGEDSGLDLVRDARAQGIRKPIIMLSALADVEDRTRGIEAGADDYVVKPFAFDELFARLQVQLIRDKARPEGFKLDPAQNTASYCGTSIQLTDREFQLLNYLAERQGTPVSRWEIYDDLWNTDGKASENIVDVYMGYLRKKLAQFTFVPAPEIRTIRNKGFMLNVFD